MTITLTREEAQQVLVVLEYPAAFKPATHAQTAGLLRARLAQPEPPCKTGSQCVGGKCPQCVVSEPEPVAKMREMLEVQGRDGTWDYDPYSHGLYNGMELMVALAEGRDPVFREAPEKWLSAPPQREWQGLTDEERYLGDARSEQEIEYARAIEAKLKEKNGD